MRRFLCEAVRRCYLLAVLLAALPSSGNLSALHAAGRTTEHAETNCPSRAERGSIPKEGARGVPLDGISDHLVEFESPQDLKSQDIVVVLSE